MRKFTSKNSEKTEEIGFDLGKRLTPGNVICLYGDLGAGKTTFVKGIAEALGIPKRDITSASFTIIAEYKTRIPFYHIDLYRLEKNSDIDGTGIWDYIYGNGIAVVEWAEHLGEPAADFIRVKFAIIDEETRDITIEGIDEKDRNNLQGRKNRTT
ncbi:MAG: tRNA (adenosine(37)-N6)-threonylcarbamoyltransferase complex ATPase subunit type 1 TsaE [Nitrospiraceae bacterium]|nr:tRNA (adenosine(37)-N6)-threonylcarbamoyltransferase complex ATPase subunit type 1 TsaE [Nitrospiraceae bacterium]